MGARERRRRRFETSGTIEQAGERRRSDVESLRALAALAVFACHVFTTAHLNDPAWSSSSLLHRMLLRTGSGVYLFYALTGYLLFRPFLRTAAGKHVDLRRYAINRIVRILPLYYAAITLLLILNPAHDPLSTGSWLRFFTFTQSYSPFTVGRVDGATWSIAVEVQFYILLPLVAIGLASLTRGSARRLVAVLSVAAFVAAALTIALTGKGPGGVGWRWSLIGSGYFFVPGMLLAVLAERRPRHIDVRPLTWIAIAIALWLLSMQDSQYAVLVAGPAAFFVIGACVLSDRPSAATSVLRWRPLAALGVVSYSFYIWHKPLIEEVSRVTHSGSAGLFLIATPTAMAIAALSYLIVESPFLRLRRKWLLGLTTSGPDRPSAKLDAP